MPKQTQCERAIAQLDSEIAVLQAAKARLVQQQAKAPARKPRVMPRVDEKAG